MKCLNCGGEIEFAVIRQYDTFIEKDLDKCIEEEDYAELNIGGSSRLAIVSNCCEEPCIKNYKKEKLLEHWEYVEGLENFQKGKDLCDKYTEADDFLVVAHAPGKRFIAVALGNGSLLTYEELSDGYSDKSTCEWKSREHMARGIAWQQWIVDGIQDEELRVMVEGFYERQY